MKVIRKLAIVLGVAWALLLGWAAFIGLVYLLASYDMFAVVFSLVALLVWLIGLAWLICRIKGWLDD